MIKNINKYFCHIIIIIAFISFATIKKSNRLESPLQWVLTLKNLIMTVVIVSYKAFRERSEIMREKQERYLQSLALQVVRHTMSKQSHE